ncbi:hypothetical protein SEA_MCGALLEON_11 [Microbacterium phage McGalleon]|uniref:Uncharacterized protein n=1 Tax=Microbacterium phage McGalleon TaxID=2590936 RepID=A0A516KQZ6_9CAUD|nr:hypothetical protein H3N88_gp11 [Microbacterium phage McGalleon]QDP44063.1 hypothetical protein SEA_MCGALLEON_11 [Microbacterium phage McGalleon]
MMSTQTLAESSRLLALLLIDEIQILNVAAEPTTVGFHVTRETTPVGEPVPALVQSTTLENAAESQTSQVFSVKVPVGTPLEAGQAVRVLKAMTEPTMVGKVLLIDKVSENGIAVLRKGVASDFEKVNQEGKEGL